MKNFFESLIARIYEIGKGIFLKFGKWLLLSGEHLHSKFGLNTMELNMHENCRVLVVDKSFCATTGIKNVTLFSISLYITGLEHS